MYSVAIALAAFLSFTGLFARGSREVRIECDHGVVAYRVEAKEGTIIEYAGKKHRIDGSGAIELVVDHDARIIRVGAQTLPLPLFGQADPFGVVTFRATDR
jgi:hypothetical protein